MSQNVDVFVTARKFAENCVELLLEAMDGDHSSWWKVYDGSLFLSMDAQSLGLLEAVPDLPNSGPKFRLRRSGRVQRDMLLRMGFAEIQGPKP